MAVDWTLIFAIATFVVASTGTLLIWLERQDRQRELRAGRSPRPHWGFAVPDAGTLTAYVSNAGPGATTCCLIVQFDDGLYSGNFPMEAYEDGGRHVLHRIDTVGFSPGPNPVACVAHDHGGRWWVLDGDRSDLLLEADVAMTLSSILRRTTNRVYECALSPDGSLSVHPSAV